MTLTNLPRTIVYQGWRLRFDPHEPQRVQWIGILGNALISSSSERGLKHKIDVINETLEELETQHA